MSRGTRTVIPARTGWSGLLTAGTRFRVIDTDGGQAADLWAFNAGRPQEHMSAQHSRVHEGEIYPRVGWTFVTNERRPILRFVEDTSPGRHDCLVAACDRPRYELLGAGSSHGSCEENLVEQAARFAIALDHAPQPINVFANFRVYPDGRLELEPCVSRPGDAATFELLMDAVVVLSACPQDIVGFQPGGPTDMAVEVLTVSPAPGGQPRSRLSAH
jgi:uncharacterized protein YcgI (DUF1989 family)